MTRKQAMDEFCRRCQDVPKGGDYSPIKDCTASGDPQNWAYCPLWEWRPGGGKKVRVLSEDQKQAASERMKRMHARRVEQHNE